jgi:hypothetical protein
LSAGSRPASGTAQFRVSPTKREGDPSIEGQHADDADASDLLVRRALAERVAHASPAVLVSARDRVHNLTAIGEDLEDSAFGTAVFSRFNAELDDVLWNHRTVVEEFLGAPDELVPPRLKGQLARALARVESDASEIAAHPSSLSPARQRRDWAEGEQAW